MGLFSVERLSRRRACWLSSPALPQKREEAAPLRSVAVALGLIAYWLRGNRGFVLPAGMFVSNRLTTVTSIDLVAATGVILSLPVESASRRRPLTKPINGRTFSKPIKIVLDHKP